MACSSRPPPRDPADADAFFVPFYARLAYADKKASKLVRRLQQRAVLEPAPLEVATGGYLNASDECRLELLEFKLRHLSRQGVWVVLVHERLRLRNLALERQELLRQRRLASRWRE